MTAKDAPTSSDRAVEILAVILLALATVGSAWCAYQSTQWNGEEARLSRESTDERVEATRQFSFGSQVISYDSGLATAYAQAYLDGDEALKKFYRDVLARPAFVPILDEWEQTADAGTGELGSLLTNQDYLDTQLAGFNEAMERSDAAADRSEDAGDNGDRYIVLTLVLAAALFFAGVTSSFRARTVQLALLTIAALLITVTAGQLSTLPII